MDDVAYPGNEDDWYEQFYKGISVTDMTTQKIASAIDHEEAYKIIFVMFMEVLREINSPDQMMMAVWKGKRTAQNMGMDPDLVERITEAVVRFWDAHKSTYL